MHSLPSREEEEPFMAQGGFRGWVNAERSAEIRKGRPTLVCLSDSRDPAGARMPKAWQAMPIKEATNLLSRYNMLISPATHINVR